MATAGDILKHKGHQVWSVTPKASTLTALKMLKDKGVGALLVLDDSKIAGIVSERDIVRRIAETTMFDPNANVEIYMTRKVQTVHPDQSVEECMRLMTEYHIRHLPVVDGMQLIGLVSIGDLVNELIHDQVVMINSLENYIQGNETQYGH